MPKPGESAIAILNSLAKDATEFLLSNPRNKVSEEDAMREDLVGMQIFEAPIFAVGAADDPLFHGLKAEGAVHPDYMLPSDWLPSAMSVLSFFAPFTDRVKAANASALGRPAQEWLHARFEGEALLLSLRRHISDWLIDAGFPSLAPLNDSRYRMLETYAPNWSERHTGYICGLGTFSLSKGLITKKGVAGRIGSVVTVAELPVTERPYHALYDYCTMCHACASNCPVQCIDPARDIHLAKAHPPCDAFLDLIRDQPPQGKSQKRRYGCGKCQTAVPCESAIP